MDRGAWRAAVHGVTEGRTRLRRLSRAHAPGDGDTGEGPGRGRRKGGGTEASAGARPGIPAEGRELGSWPAVPIPRGRVSGGVAALACPSWLISARSESPGSGQDGRQPRVRPIRPLTAQLPPPLSPQRSRGACGRAGTPAADGASPGGSETLPTNAGPRAVRVQPLGWEDRLE